ncbi:MAG: hypothetical protein ACYDCL_19835 [Myxococcales bacterium]
MEHIQIGMPVIAPDGRKLGRVSGFDEGSVLVRRHGREMAVSLEEVAQLREGCLRLTSRADTLLHQYTRGQAAVGLDTLVH